MSGAYAPLFRTVPYTNFETYNIHKREDKFVSNPAIAKLQPTMGKIKQGKKNQRFLSEKKQFYHRSKMLEAWALPKYKNVLPEQRNKMIYREAEKNNFASKMSDFFKNPRDGEMSNRRNVVNIYTKNPEFIASELSWQERIDALDKDPNTIAVPVMEESGQAVFDYDREHEDQVDIVKESNQSFVERRDRFLIPPAPGQDVSPIAELLEKGMKNLNVEEKKKVREFMADAKEEQEELKEGRVKSRQKRSQSAPDIRDPSAIPKGLPERARFRKTRTGGRGTPKRGTR